MEYSISKLAEEFGLTTRTIRYYEELKLIKPKRSVNGKRVYSSKEYTRLKLIVRGKKFGFSLEEIKEMIHLFDRDPTGRKQLERSIEYGDEKLKEVNERIRDLIKMKEELEKLRGEFARRLEEKGKEE